MHHCRFTNDFLSPLPEHRLALVEEGVHALLLVLGARTANGTARRSKAMPSASGASKARLTLSLAIITLGRLSAQIAAAAASASSISLSAGTTRETRPARSASAASIMRPVSTMSIAFALPTARGRRCVPPAPGMMPSLISGWPNFARVGGDDEVAHHRQLAAAAEREAGHRGDHRLAHLAHRLPVAA